MPMPTSCTLGLEGPVLLLSVVPFEALVLDTEWDLAYIAVVAGLPANTTHIADSAPS